MIAADTARLAAQRAAPANKRANRQPLTVGPSPDASARILAQWGRVSPVRSPPFVLGAVVGWFVGLSAGRGPYEAIARAVRRVGEHPGVQGTAGVISARAGVLLSAARRRPQA